MSDGTEPVKLEDVGPLIPDAIDWAEQQAAFISAQGAPLSDAMIEVARGVGVGSPQSIRTLSVDQIPGPSDPQLRRAAEEIGLLGPHITGLTLGYGIFLASPHKTLRLISHECRHVQQYEAHGGIGGFLPIYLEQIMRFGYWDAPMEVDARSHELRCR